MGQQTPAVLEPPPPTRVRFGVLGFACSLSMLTYIDRICISRVQEDIQRDLHFSDAQMGLVFGAFTIGYGLFEVPGGWMGDVWGNRRVLTRIVLLWSLFTALTGAVDQLLDLGLGDLLTAQMVLWGMLVVRFLFGCGAAGAFPNLTRVIGSWFPYSERGLAQGAIWMAARLGGGAAPLVMGRLAAAYGWRMGFYVFAVAGVVWAVWFYFWFRDSPEEKSSCNEGERAIIHAGPYSWKAHDAAGGHPPTPWRHLLASPTLWCLCLTSTGVSFGWYFFTTWQPRYFKDVFGLSFAKSEVSTGLPFLCGAVGSLLGGSLSDWLVRRTGSRRWGRSLVGLGGFSGAGVCMFLTGLATEAWVAVTLLCLAFFINDLAIPPIWAACSDIGGRYAGTIAGVMNMAGGIGAFLSPALTPIVLDAFDEGVPLSFKWLVIFAGLSSAWFIAALAWLGIDASKPIVHEEDHPTTT